MTFALVIVEKPEGRPWPDQIRPKLQTQPTPEGVTRMNESAWLIDVDANLLFLASLIEEAHSCKLGFRTAFFDKEPSFIYTSN
jgi:hypothetical protein